LTAELAEDCDEVISAIPWCQFFNDFGLVDIVPLGEDALRELRRTRISMVFQHFALLPNKSVIENAEFGLKLRGVAAAQRRRRAEEVLAIVGLAKWAYHRPHELSGGMRQRVGLARALATDADVLIMDEAFSALDPLIRTEMQDELLRLQRTLKKTILFITHDFQEALKLGTRIAIMSEGELVREGNTAIDRARTRQRLCRRLHARSRPVKGCDGSRLYLSFRLKTDGTRLDRRLDLGRNGADIGPERKAGFVVCFRLFEQIRIVQ
jgi:ABC-type nitrate/sulfonate/bicarbonate transport system ATPase subunit